jgi:hypothetical protein
MADDGAVCGTFLPRHDTDMTTDRAPVIRLLTAPEAADRIGVQLGELERLVDVGALTVLRVSARDGRRFWPADVDAAADSVTEVWAATEAEAVATKESSADPVPPVVRRRPAARRRTAPQRPRWAGFAFAPHRVRRVYLAFRDPEHVVGYLEARRGARAES